ncbi:MAG TPA: MFS transporter, partial [Blastocatellia bacterium]|nr:MFS transporter [Blastocatellia bacterium]
MPWRLVRPKVESWPPQATESIFKGNEMQSQNRWRLSLMMFLQYAIWGAWSPDLSVYLKKIEFADTQSGVIYSLLPVGCMLAPFVAGQLADRYFATEKLIGILHLTGGVLMFLMAGVTNYHQFWPLMLAWSIVYGPTLALTNSLCFHHMPEAEKEFGVVRVWGTIGWIVVGLALSKLLRIVAP